MKQTIAAFAMLLLSFCASAQQQFFKSAQTFAESQFKSFYSSVSIQGNLLLFMANDYYLYAYDKNTGEMKWRFYASYKTKLPVYTNDKLAFVPYYVDEQEQTATVDITNGTLVKKLPLGPLATKPVVKNNILYGTAIYDAGCLFAYDLNKDTVVWYRFVAHGVSNQPYYFENNIIANAEASNWFSIGYDGILTDTSCKEKADIFVQNIPCIRNFSALSHDQKEITESQTQKWFGEDVEAPEPVYSPHYTFLLHGDKLAIVGNKLKTKAIIEIASLSDTLEIDPYEEGSILKADDEKICLYHSNFLLVYNHKTKKLERAINLSAWSPYQLTLDGNRLWLVSRKDGLLYGINY